MLSQVLLAELTAQDDLGMSMSKIHFYKRTRYVRNIISNDRNLRNAFLLKTHTSTFCTLQTWPTHLLILHPGLRLFVSTTLLPGMVLLDLLHGWIILTIGDQMAYLQSYPVCPGQSI